MAGTCNSVRCLPTSALSRVEVTGDFGGSLMRQSSKVRVYAPIMEFKKSGSLSLPVRSQLRTFSATVGMSQTCQKQTSRSEKPRHCVRGFRDFRRLSKVYFLRASFILSPGVNSEAPLVAPLDMPVVRESFILSPGESSEAPREVEAPELFI